MESSSEYVLLSVLHHLLEGQCNPDLRLLGCSVLAPRCEGGHVRRPCRRVCEALREACQPAFDAIDMAWPYFLDCGHYFGGEEEGCYDPLEKLRGKRGLWGSVVWRSQVTRRTPEAWERASARAPVRTHAGRCHAGAADSVRARLPRGAGVLDCSPRQKSMHWPCPSLLWGGHDPQEACQAKPVTAHGQSYKTTHRILAGSQTPPCRVHGGPCRHMASVPRGQTSRGGVGSPGWW